MAMPAIEKRRYTVDEVLALPEDGNQYELLHGELVVSPAPAPLHERAFTRLFHALSSYMLAQGLLETLHGSRADITWSDDVLVQPDLFVVAPTEVSNSWKTYKTLLLAVEILSPSSRRRDRVEKRAIYAEYHVRTYWIVDAESALVEVWTPNEDRPQIVTDRLRWRATGDGPDLDIDLPTFFAALALPE